jgi:tetratricopeptide (TPR) repeat protein
MILLAVLLTANVMMAQKKDRTDAFMYNKNGQYAKAMASIEKCVHHEQFLGMKPNDQATAWHYRAIIYQNVLQSGDEALIAQTPDALEIIYESLMNCMKNPSFLEDNKQDIYQRVEIVKSNYYNSGYELFKTQDYAAAAPLFKKAYDIAKTLGTSDANDMLYAAGQASMLSKDFNTALEYFTELKNNGMENGDVYRHLAACYNGLGNAEQAMAMINAGLEKDPSDANLILEKVNAYLKDGKGAEAIADLEKLLELDPENAQLLFVLGTIYGDDGSSVSPWIGQNKASVEEVLGKPINTDVTTTAQGTGEWWMYDNNQSVHFHDGIVDIVKNVTATPKVKVDQPQAKLYDPEKARQYYEQALKIKPDYYDATYNIGVLYTTMANKYIEQANEITGFSKAEQEQYNNLIEQANELLRTGLPYLKQAYDAQPTDDVKNVLKSMYVKLNMMEEVKALELIGLTKAELIDNWGQPDKTTEYNTDGYQSEDYTYEAKKTIVTIVNGVVKSTYRYE